MFFWSLFASDDFGNARRIAVPTLLTLCLFLTLLIGLRDQVGENGSNTSATWIAPPVNFNFTMLVLLVLPAPILSGGLHVS